MTVLIRESPRSLRIDKEPIRKITDDLLTSLRLQDRDLNILFVTNEKIRAINRKYFDRDKPTNVISFSYLDGLSPEVIGDIVISIDRAREEADRISVPFCERVLGLVIHGLLHIVGFIHENDRREARRMKYREKKLLALATSHPLYKQLIKGSP
jgi:probable rRNA maturation factor